jgi:hypothetical protein
MGKGMGTRPPGNRRKYPWEEWFARPRFRLRRGRDYSVSTSAMAQMVRNKASEFSVSVHLIEPPDGSWLEVTVSLKGEDDA